MSQPDQPVRVVCPECGARGPLTVKSNILGDYPECRGATCDGSGTILATLADPEMAALIEDGGRWRNRVPEALAILESGTAYERLHVENILRGVPNA